MHEYLDEQWCNGNQNRVIKIKKMVGKDSPMEYNQKMEINTLWLMEKNAKKLKFFLYEMRLVEVEISLRTVEKEK